MKRILFYTFYTLAAVAVFLYALFPEQAVLRYVETEVTEKSPDLDLAVERIRPALPPGLTLSGVSVSFKNAPLFQADTVRVSALMGSLLSGKPGVSVSARAYGGKIKASAVVDKNNQEAPLSASLEIKGVAAGKVKGLEQLMKKSVSGDLSAQVDYQGKIGDYLGASGKGEFSLKDGKTRVFADLLGIDALNFNEVSAQWTMEKGAVDVKEWKMDGREVNGGISGRVFLARPLSGCQLDLHGSVQPTTALFQKIGTSSPMARFLRQNQKDGGIPLSITGTASQSNIEFM